MAMQKGLTGLRKAAIVALLIGEEQSSDVLRHLREDEIEKLAKEMAGLGHISASLGETVLEEFHQNVISSEFAGRGDVDYANRVLRATLGDEAARRVMDKVQRSFEYTPGFDSIEHADRDQLSKFILGDHPQTIALILAHLHSGHAAQLVTLLPDHLRADVLTRIARLDDIRPDVNTRISSVIEQRVR